jgi:hypothetical protein
LVGIGEYSTRCTCSLSEYVLLTPTAKTTNAADCMGDTHSLDFSCPCCSISLPSPQYQHMSQLGSGRASVAGLRQQVAVEADGGEWKRAQPSSLPVGGVKPSSPPVTCPSVTYCCTFPNAQGVPETPLVHHIFVSFPLQASNTYSPLIGLPSLPLPTGWAPSTSTPR